MSLRRGRARAELNAEINVVSLIDVMMLLLVIFMITAPMMQGGVEISLPEVNSAPVEPKGLIITVTANAVYVDQQKMTDGVFRSGFKAIAGSRVKDGVVLMGDKSISYDRLMRIMEIVTLAGVTNVSLGTTPPETPNR